MENWPFSSEHPHPWLIFLDNISRPPRRTTIKIKHVTMASHNRRWLDCCLLGFMRSRSSCVILGISSFLVWLWSSACSSYDSRSMGLSVGNSHSLRPIFRKSRMIVLCILDDFLWNVSRSEHFWKISSNPVISLLGLVSVYGTLHLWLFFLIH